MDMNSLLAEIDKRVRAKYNKESISSIFVDNDKSILYFDDQGLPLALYTPYLVGQSWDGQQIGIDEFDYRDKLPSGVI